MATLEVRGLSRYFGRLAALDGIDLEIEEGELVGLVGPNGAGKTTLFNVISGFYSPTRGTVVYQGKTISKLRADQIAALGIIRTFQGNVLYREATVLDNVLRGSHLASKTNSWQAFLGTPRYRREEKELLRKAKDMLEFWGLADLEDVRAGDLPHGDQRRLGLTIALAADPKILLIDEPVGGMSSEERIAVIEHIRALHSLGITVIVVEHHVQTVLSLCQRLVVLSFGRKLADGPPLEVTTRPDVIEAYLGVDEEVEDAS